MNLSNEDTIAAIATPNGTGAISVIRISGSLAFNAIDRIFSGKQKIGNSTSHSIHYGKILDRKGNLVDNVLISVFRNPHSYTGEDSVEISSHGNPFISKQIIELLTENGLRMAEPGEFTKRAYLNGKIDLTQAEAVIDVISSRTKASLLGARNQLDGLLSKKVSELRDMLLNASSFVELELDFAEEGIEFIDQKELSARIDKIVIEIESLLKTYSFGRVIKDGVNVALVGKPNVGKSSILNYILKESRAIVSEIPGTTRDVIREDVSIDGILFKLFDTAGIRVSDNEIEKEGVLRSREVVKNSDVVLFISDVEQPYSEDILTEIRSLAKKENILNILNKIDIRQNQNGNHFDVEISAKTGEGIDKLFLKLKEISLGNSDYSERSAVVSNLRHFQCLKKAKKSLNHAKGSINNRLSGEFIAVDLRDSIYALNEIIGEVTSEDILNNIFSKFCIGK